MTDEDLIGYLLDALDPADRDAVEATVRANPDAAARLDRLRLALAPLAAAREPVPPPAGLAVRTVARLAAHLVEHEPRAVGPSAAVPAPPRPLPRAPREEPEPRVVGGRFRPDLVVACGIALFAGGLVFSAVGKVRSQNQMLACQQALRTIHLGLTGYADTHGGRYPQVGTTDNPTAESFAQILIDAGQVPAGFRHNCPGADPADPAAPPVYTYTLGYRTPDGGLVGLRQPDGTGGEHDLVPISGDYPTADAAPAAGPICPHRTMNVLYAGGTVRGTTSPLIGPGGDHIYRNMYGDVAAGAGRTDVVLGRRGDRP